jgi:phage nucleotide-binding protein
MAIQFTTTQEAGKSHGVKVLVYGRAGAGKTRLIETCPRPIIFSAESGLLSLAHTSIPVATIRNIKDLADAYEWAVMSPDAKNFDTICLDSISEIAEALLSAERKKSKDPRQAYGEMQDQIATQIRMFRDLPGKHVYFSAKLEQRNSESTGSGAAQCGPAMPGSKTSQGMAYYFDEVFMLGIGNVPGTTPPQTYRYLQTQPDFMNEAKDRSGKLDPVEEANLGKIFQKITG